MDYPAADSREMPAVIAAITITAAITIAAAITITAAIAITTAITVAAIITAVMPAPGQMQDRVTRRRQRRRSRRPQRRQIPMRRLPVREMEAPGQVEVRGPTPLRPDRMQVSRKRSQHLRRTASRWRHRRLVRPVCRRSQTLILPGRNRDLAESSGRLSFQWRAPVLSSVRSPDL